MNKIIFSLLLLATFFESVALPNADLWHRQFAYKYALCEKVNNANEHVGKAHLNQYLIELDPNWIEERPDRQLLSNNYDQLAQILTAFNTKRKDKLRFYVVVVNNYRMNLNEKIDVNRLPTTISNLGDLVVLPDKNTQYKRYADEISSIPRSISAELAQKQYDERMVYFYGSIQLVDLSKKERTYRHDNLTLVGGRLKANNEKIRKEARNGWEANGAAGINIEKLIANLINAVERVIDQTDNTTEAVNCEDKADDLVTKTQQKRDAQYNNQVTAFTTLINNANNHRIYNSAYLIAENAEDLPTDNVFLSKVLPDKLNLLAQGGNSNYRLYIVFKEIQFVMPTGDWEQFAQQAVAASNMAGQAGTIVIVMPFYKTFCTGSNWLGMPISQGTGLVMPGVVCGDATIQRLMNAALMGAGKTFEANFNQAFQHIPKKHVVYAYSFLWNGDYIKHTSYEEKNVTGYSNIYDLIISDDGRYEKLQAERINLSASLSTLTQMREEDSQQNYTAFVEALERLSLDRYFLQAEQIINTDLTKVEFVNDVKQSTLVDEKKADQYAIWSWNYKTNTRTAQSPSDEWFYGGVNKRAARQILNFIDIASFAVSFVGLDVVFDTWGAYYAFDKGFNQEGAIYLAAVAIGVVTAGELKALVKTADWVESARKAELVLVKQFYNNKLVLSKTGRLYSTLLPLITELRLEKILSKNLLAAMESKPALMRVLYYARKTDYQSSIKLFEQALSEKASFKTLINTNTQAVDDFFVYLKDKPTATLDEVLEAVEKQAVTGAGTSL